MIGHTAFGKQGGGEQDLREIVEMCRIRA